MQYFKRKSYSHPPERTDFLPKKTPILTYKITTMMISRTAAAAASHPKYHKNTILQPNVF